MDANHQKYLRLIGRNHSNDETVRRSGMEMSARSGAGLHQGVGVLQSAADTSASAVLGRSRHTREDFPNARLVAPAIEFEISARHVKGRDQPAISEPYKVRPCQV
jgi:hypothetical protein